MIKCDLKQLIQECVHEILESDDYVHFDDFIERRDRILHKIINDFLKGAKHIYWPTIKSETLANVWLKYGKYGIVDEEAMEKIADQMIDLVARLTVSTELSGHTPDDVREELDGIGYTFTDKQWKKLLDTLEDKDGQWYLSNYGLEPLKRLALRLYKAETPEDKLHIVDRMLNVVHQRSDLAAMFVQGGTTTLNKIENQGGYRTKFDDFADQVRQQRSY